MVGNNDDRFLKSFGVCYVDFLDKILVSSSVGKYFMDNRLFYSYELGTLSLLGGSQWGSGFYGYRLKFWLFYGYRLIFSVTVNEKVKN